ncbi:alkaline phosphatase family protein, partial [Verrucomicrobiota bacterium]
IDPRHQAYPITYPESFGKELVKSQGMFHTLGMPEMVHPLSHGRYDRDAFLSEVEVIENERVHMLESELNRFDSGLLAFVIDHTDRLQHVFGAIQDKEHPAYSEKSARKYADVVPSMYRRMDKIVGNVLNTLDDRTMLMVVSDHGFTSFRYSVHMNRWLIRNGYMTLNKDNPGEGKSLFRNVDWARTKAYALGFASIYINLKDREAKGVVSPGQERDKVCKQLAGKLRAFKDPRNGNPVVHSVVPSKGGDPARNNKDIPDLLVGFKPNYRMSWQTALGGAPEGLIADNDSKWMADHIIAPELIPGAIFCNRKINTAKPQSIDIAPTVLDCFGIDCSGYMDGHSLLGS